MKTMIAKSKSLLLDAQLATLTGDHSRATDLVRLAALTRSAANPLKRARLDASLRTGR